MTDWTYTDSDTLGIFIDRYPNTESGSRIFNAWLKEVRRKAWSEGNLAGSEGYFESRNPYRGEL